MSYSEVLWSAVSMATRFADDHGGSLRESKPCLLCGSNDAQVVYAFPADYYDHARFETASWDGRLGLPLQIVRCTHCELLYSSPSFRAEALDHVYPSDLVAEATTFETALEQTRRKHAWLLKRLRAQLSSGSVCDVGSRYGVLPYLARNAGYDAFGIEYNAAAVKVACDAGVPVYQGTAQDVARALRDSHRTHVDAFVLDDVLEHLVNPVAALQALSACQRAGGLLFLQQMDLDSLGHRLFRRHWYYLQPAAHMYYFHEPTLRALLQKSGYEVVQVERTPRLRNLGRTLTRTLPGATLKFLRASMRRSHLRAKPSYLTQRLRSADDMFLVVARKVAARD